MDRQSIQEGIVALEWEMFTRVENEGGRASCQDDKDTFEIMRMSQFDAWGEPVLDSYYDDLTRAVENGDNILAYKYGYMMAYSHPGEYERVKAVLPPVTKEKERLAREITDILVAWYEEFASCYPQIAGRGRPIRMSDEPPGFVSVENYTFCELLTMSEETLALYAEYVGRLKAGGRNMAFDIQNSLVCRYGYKDMEDAERRMKNGAVS
jgi:hypothetical protein